MPTCAALAAQLKILEHLLSQTGTGLKDQERRQELLDQIDDVKQQQDAQGCLSATYADAIGPDGLDGAIITLWMQNPQEGPFNLGEILHFAFPNNTPGSFTVDSFTVTVNSYQAQVGEGKGIYDATNQLMTVDVELDFLVPSHDDSKGYFYLSTNGSITPPDGNTYSGQFIDAQGHVTFVASTTFIQGALTGATGYLLVDCLLKPWPPQL